MKSREETFIYFCERYFNEYALDNVEVLNHNATRHGTLDSIKTYYIANIRYFNVKVTVTIDIKDFETATSVSDMVDIMNKHVYNCIFMYNIDMFGKSVIDGSKEFN